ncbi:MAG: MBL fold metallo-hydrolase [Ferroplasma sp.]
MDELHILNDGSYVLDSGAYCGIVPKAIWSRYFHDENNRIRIGTNVPLATINGKNYIMDAGIGNNFDEKFLGIFKPEKSSDIEEQIKNTYNLKSIDSIIISHMHFDHCGHLYSGSNIFKGSKVVLQEKELKAFRQPNEFTRGSYIRQKIHGKLHTLNGSYKLNGNINIIYTGGHTEGHQAIIFEINSTRYLYGGDLFASLFHLKPYYITAIDSYPITTLKIKKKLINKAIREHMRIILNHDNENTVGEIYGTVEKPQFNKIDMDF